MPKPPKSLQTKSLERIQSELWQLERVSEEATGVNAELIESVDTLSTNMEEMSENIEDLNKTIKSAMRMIEDMAEAKEAALKEAENA